MVNLVDRPYLQEDVLCDVKGFRDGENQHGIWSTEDAPDEWVIQMEVDDDLTTYVKTWGGRTMLLDEDEVEVLEALLARRRKVIKAFEEGRNAP